MRIYEGCGRAYLGAVEGANIIKIHRRSGKLSYVLYPAFETDPHPALLRCVRLNLRSRQIECYDCARSANPPVLHRKEAFLHAEHPLYAKFQRLTLQEDKSACRTSRAASARVTAGRSDCARGLIVRGHRLMRSEATA